MGEMPLESAEESQGLGIQLPYRLGRYTLCRELGAGGMATVYLGRMRLAEGFERMVALKTIHGHLAKAKTFVDMFLDEASIASQIGHPNVCSVYDFGNVGGTYYLALEYLMGEPLDDFINQVVAKRDDDLMRTLPYLAARILADACKGLQAAHDTRGNDGQPLNIIHRDVSPQNLFVTYDGSVKVVDFGCAKAIERVTHTDTGVMKGKVSYAAPEQLKGEALDARVDVWALGVCLWETLTLRELFRRDTAIQSAMAVLEEAIPRADEVADWVPQRLADIAEKALSRDRDQRYASAKDMGRDLRGFIAKSGVSFESAELAEWMGHLFEERQQEVRQMVSEVEAGARVASAAEGRADGHGVRDSASGIGEAATAVAKIPSARNRRDAPAEPEPTSSRPLRLDLDDEPVVLPTRGRGWLWALALLLIGGGAVGGLFYLGDGDLGAGLERVRGGFAEPPPAPPASPEVTVEVEREVVRDDAPPTGGEGEPVVVVEGTEGAAPAEAVAPDVAGAAPSPATPEGRATEHGARPTPRRGTERPAERGAASAPTPTPAPSPGAEPAPERASLDISRGRIHVIAEGGWAEVFHDGTSLGRTPVETSLPVGSQRLRLLPYGREPAQHVSVAVEWGAINRVRIRLSPEPAPPAPPEPADEPSSRPTNTVNPYEGGDFEENDPNPY